MQTRFWCKHECSNLRVNSNSEFWINRKRTNLEKTPKALTYLHRQRWPCFFTTPPNFGRPTRNHKIESKFFIKNKLRWKRKKSGMRSTYAPITAAQLWIPPSWNSASSSLWTVVKPELFSNDDGEQSEKRVTSNGRVSFVTTKARALSGGVKSDSWSPVHIK